MPDHASAPSTRIDKNLLTFPEPHRVRDKEHLRYVAAQPCLLCSATPSDPHHVRFAQPRAMARKVGDDFTVPLCRKHHRDLHDSGNEAAWWHDMGIEPLEIARGPLGGEPDAAPTIRQRPAGRVRRGRASMPSQGLRRSTADRGHREPRNTRRRRSKASDATLDQKWTSLVRGVGENDRWHECDDTLTFSLNTSSGASRFTDAHSSTSSTSHVNASKARGSSEKGGARFWQNKPKTGTERACARLQNAAMSRQEADNRLMLEMQNAGTSACCNASRCRDSSPATPADRSSVDLDGMWGSARSPDGLPRNNPGGHLVLHFRVLTRTVRLGHSVALERQSPRENWQGLRPRNRTTRSPQGEVSMTIRCHAGRTAERLRSETG